MADGIFLARDLVNEPPNVLYPAEFARRAKALAKLGVKVEVLGEAEMKKQGFGALLGVGQGIGARKPACGDAMERRARKERTRPSPLSARACVSIPAACRSSPAPA